MKEILFNIALIETINFCKRNDIDCSGSHLEKAKRGYSYSLIKEETGKPLVIVTLNKRSVPTFMY